MKYSQEVLVRIIDCLNQGGVVCFPTETVYALSCDANNQEAINRIYQIKQRPMTKAFAVLVDSIGMAKHYVEINNFAEDFIEKHSPGPVSYVLPIKENAELAHFFTNNKTLAFRIPDHKIAQDILRNYGKALVGTSVNISSQASAVTFQDVPESLKLSIDVLIEEDKPTASGISSTIFDLSSQDIRILRAGEIDLKKK
ncbi:MAG: threonylcarbamoyl-AMP synthase [Rickettsiales bacterium]|nr:threonylcarbamoyl-AMP synthase [Rickettsiales bacterium]